MSLATKRLAAAQTAVWVKGRNSDGWTFRELGRIAVLAADREMFSDETVAAVADELAKEEAARLNFDWDTLHEGEKDIMRQAAAGKAQQVLGALQRVTNIPRRIDE